jgi:hypothetical protein
MATLAVAPALAEDDLNEVDTEFLEFLGSWERGDADMFEEIWEKELRESDSQTGKVERDDEKNDVERSDDPA